MSENDVAFEGQQDLFVEFLSFLTFCSTVNELFTADDFWELLEFGFFLLGFTSWAKTTPDIIVNTKM